MAARTHWTAALSLALCALSLPASAQSRAKTPIRLTDRLIVRLKSGPTGLASLESAGYKQVRGGARLGLSVVQIPAGQDLKTATKALLARGDVAFVEPDVLMPPANNPNDPKFTTQWHLAKIAAPTAWDSSTGSPNVVIAVLDSGCDPTHPDLAPKYVPGWNFYDNNSNTTDVQGHGTAVAGTAAAASNNSTGVAAPAWGCKLMPIRISDTTGYAYWSTVADALVWAADHGARVANISYQCSDSATVQSAAQYFQSKGGVVVASAGNAGAVLTTPDTPYILTVAATDSNDLTASWSNQGPIVDLAAPGVNVYSTLRGNAYGFNSGTSFSAPLTAGVCALVLSANPNLTGAQVQQILKDSADDKGALGWDPKYGWGRINAGRAVQKALQTGGTLDLVAPTVAITAPTAGATLSGIVSLTATAVDNVGVASVSFYANGALAGTATAAPFSISWNSAKVANGGVTIQAVAKDTAGNLTSSSVSASVYNTDSIPPTITLISPTSGTTVRNSINVQVNASDNVGVLRVELYVDGALVNSTTAPPYSMTWNAKKASAGAHTLYCKAYDLAGNAASTGTITVYH